MVRKKRNETAYMISNVAKTYDVHPQTLRLYERHGLLKPSRSEGNTRLYTEEDLERLELILNLTRELGVNLAGVEIILNMRARVEEMQKEIRQFMELIQTELSGRMPGSQAGSENALVRTTPAKIVRLDR